jgi:hypothetical protein
MIYCSDELDKMVDASIEAFENIVRADLCDGLGPLPPCAQTVVYNESKGYSFDAYTADQMRSYALAERGRIAALIAQHSGLTLETLEYLETMRQGPTTEEWAALDARA